MFTAIESISRATTRATTKTNQVESLLDAAKNRIGKREGLQQWINRKVLSLPNLPDSKGKVFTLVREYDEVYQDVSQTLWTIALLSIQQQGYTSIPLLSSVIATSINSSTLSSSVKDDWRECSIWMLNELHRIGMVEFKMVETTNKFMQKLFYIDGNWAKVNLNPIIEELREKTSIICKPLQAKPEDWREGETEQRGTKLKLVSRKADTLVKYEARATALEALNKLQRVSFEVSNSREEIFHCMDAEKDELKRASFQELLELKGSFYFPVSCDYRFRMYYRGGTVHPQAQKEVRQFLNFSKGEVVNRREAMKDLEKALAGRENPVQRKELERLKGMHEDFVSCKVIVHLDGIANGLQHQAVLLRSRKLAELTKLIVSDGEEVYQHMVNCIEEEGVEVTRKFIKEVIMTASYGATRSTQLKALCKKLEMKEAKQVYELIHKELPELRKFSQFIESRCKDFANKSCEMETPDGYSLSFRKVDRTESTIFAGSFSAIVGTTFKEDAKATARATAPNIIHMIDAYHLRLVIKEWSGNISTIHDSVGVVAGRGKEIQRLILSTFKKVHSNNILNNWAENNRVTGLQNVGKLRLEEVNNEEMFN